MTLRLAFALAGVVVAFPAAASSITVLPAAAEGPSPSIVHVGAPASGSSVVALGTPDVENIQVSSIGETQGQADEAKTEPSFRSRTPMVIRGGMVGDAFTVSASSTPAPVVQASQERTSTATPRQEAAAERKSPALQKAMPASPSGGIEAVR